MPNGTITSTENTFGTVNGALSGTVAGTLTGSVGVPGPQGPPGPGSTWGTILGTLSAQTDLWSELGTKYLASNPAGYQTAGQVSTALAPYITSATATASFYPLTGNPSAFLTASALTPYLTSATAASTYQTLAGMSSYLTTSAAASSYYPLSSNPSAFLTSSALTGYATQSFVASNYAPIAAGLPAGGTVGQVLTKNSGTDYDDSWQTLIPGDRYLTSSTTSNTIGNGAKTFTVGTGLSYSSQQDVVISFDASNHMHAVVTSYNSGTGALVVDVKSHTGSGTYTAWTVNVGGTTPLQSVEWGEILGTLGDQTDLATALNAKLESSTAATTYAALAGATFTGEVVTPASTTSSAGLTITPGVAPTTPTNGEIWATTNDLQVRLNGVTETLAEQSWVTAQGYITSSALTPYAPLAGATFTGKVNTLTPTTTTAGLNLPHGAAPTTPVNGDLFTTTSGLFARINGTTRQYVDLDGTQTINGSKTFSNANQTIGNSTAAGTIAIGTGATVSGSTRTIQIGINAAAGSTNNITIGSTTGTSTTTLVGSTVGTTLAADTNTTGLATTAYVVGQAGSAAPLINGTATVGTSLRYARQDHVHPTDTTRAPLASPSLTGVPAAPTAAVDTNTTQLATTAYVVAQAAAATPLVDGTAAVGTSLRYARADHVHPTDTTRAPLNSPAFTGTPSLPTGTTAFTQTAGTNNTTLATTAFVTAAVPAAATVAEAKAGTDTAKFISANVLQKVVNSPSYYKFPRGVMSTASSGTGATVTTGALITWLQGTTTGSGWAQHEYYGFSGVDIIANTGWTVGNADINFSKQFRLTGSTNLLGPMATNTVVRCMFGKQANDAGGDPTTKCIGWRYSQSTGFIEIIAHNGTSLVTLTTASNPASGSWFEWELYNNGSGNVQMFVNDVSIGTLTSGPTGNTFAAAPTYVEEIQTTATPSAQPSVRFRNGGLFLQP